MNNWHAATRRPGPAPLHHRSGFVCGTHVPITRLSPHVPMTASPFHATLPSRPTCLLAAARWWVGGVRAAWRSFAWVFLAIGLLLGLEAGAEPLAPQPAGRFSALEDPSRVRTLSDIRADTHGWQPATSISPGFSHSV